MAIAERDLLRGPESNTPVKYAPQIPYHLPSILERQKEKLRERYENLDKNPRVVLKNGRRHRPHQEQTHIQNMFEDIENVETLMNLAEPEDVNNYLDARLNVIKKETEIARNGHGVILKDGSVFGKDQMLEELRENKNWLATTKGRLVQDAGIPLQPNTQTKL